MLAELQAKAKLGGRGVIAGAEGAGAGVGVGVGKKPSDEVEGLKFEVKWEPTKGAFGVKVVEQDVRVEEGELSVVSCSYYLHGWVYDSTRFIDY